MNKSKTAKLIGVSRPTLYEILKNPTKYKDLTNLLEIKEDVVEETVTLATSLELGKKVREHINQERARIHLILDEAITEAKKNI